MSKNAKNSITLQEFDFLRAYIDIGSDSFANARRSCIQAGYSESYCRVIKRNYPKHRLIMLKETLKDEGLVRMIEATRNLDFGTPIISEAKLKRIIRERERELIGMSSKEVISAIENLLR